MLLYIAENEMAKNIARSAFGVRPDKNILQFSLSSQLIYFFFFSATLLQENLAFPPYNSVHDMSKETKEKPTAPTKDEEQNKTCLPRSFQCLRKPLETVLEFCDTYFLAIGMIFMVIVGSQWPELGTLLSANYFPQICFGGCFFLCGLRTTTKELITAVQSYKALAWGILTILLVVPITGTQITKTIQFATMREDNMTTSQSTVVGNITAIGPTEFAFALQVFFTVPASMAAGAVLVRTIIVLILVC